MPNVEFEICKQCGHNSVAHKLRFYQDEDATGNNGNFYEVGKCEKWDCRCAKFEQPGIWRSLWNSFRFE